MEKRKKLLDGVRSRLISGRLRKPELLLSDTEKRDAPNWVKRMVEASTQFRLVNGLVKNGRGDSVSAIAFWKNGFRIRTKGSEVRVWILVVQREDSRWYYGIPANAYDKLKKLPGSDFTSKEVQLLLAMADTVNEDTKKQEELVCVEHPAADTIASQRKPWLEISLDCDALYPAFTSTALNVEILAATIDAQFPTLGDVTGLPRGVTTFITTSSDDTGRNYVRAVSGAATFANEPGPFQSGVHVRLKDIRNA